MSYDRLKAFAHWIKLEKDPDEERLMLANDIEKILAELKAARKVVEAARRYIASRKVLMENQKEVDWDAFENLESALEKLEGGEK